MAFRIDYDDDQLDIMGKILKELNSIGIPVEFKDDGLEHDGFMIFNVVKSESSDLYPEPLRVFRMYMHKEDFEGLLKFADHS